MLLVLIPISAGIYIFSIYVRDGSWHYGLPGIEFYTIAVVSFFFISDLLICNMLKMKDLDYQAYENSAKYVDAPTLFAVCLITMFEHINITGFDLKVFTAGASTFQLLAFNLLFTIFLVVEIRKKKLQVINHSQQGENNVKD